MKHIHTATVLVEATTPLKIGTGEPGLNTDELIATDANGLPIIPGTALTGVLRHQLEQIKDKDKNFVNDFFGFQKGKQGEGSKVIISNGHFVGENGEVIEGLKQIDFSKGFYSYFKKLAIRDHTKINHQGVADAENRGKFDSQVVFKGCRFVFSIELQNDTDSSNELKEILKILSLPLFRIGAGTRKGFGELKVISIESDNYDLSDKIQLEKYLNKSAKLSIPKTNNVKFDENEDKDKNMLINYQLTLTPENFFIFSSGYPEGDVDMAPKKERYIHWKDKNKPVLKEEKILIPATSVKGAISHRTAFHYNRLQDNFADKTDNLNKFVGEENEAVRTLFGLAKDSNKDKEYGQRGKVLLSDIFIDKVETKIFNHVAIDRFTGGAIDGALFNEEVVTTEEKITLNIAVEKDAFKNNDKIRQAFEKTLKDIATGMLPLGGSTMRGHGCFTGTITKNGEELK